MANISLVDGIPVELYALTGITPGTRLNVYNVTGRPVRVSDTQVGLNTNYRTLTFNGTATNARDDVEAWAVCYGGGCELNVTVATSWEVNSVSRQPNDLELDVAGGDRAWVQQSYDEMNKKKAMQWEASRLINAAQDAKYYSILKVGPNKTVDLKTRILSGTIGGGIGRTYAITDSDYTGGTIDPWYNMRPGVGGNPEALLISAPTLITPVENLTKIGADYHFLANTQGNQGGVNLQLAASNRILDLNYQLLFEIESKSIQFITSRLEIYEGGLDYPL